MLSAWKSLQLQGILPQIDFIWPFQLSFLPNSVDFTACVCVCVCTECVSDRTQGGVGSPHVLVHFSA